MRSLYSLILFLACPALMLGLAAASPPDKPDAAGFEFFEKKIRPILVAECYACHSADSKPLRGGLLLDSRAGLLKGGDHGTALVAGQPEKSLLVRAARYTDPNIKMPPKGKLSDKEIAALTEWVKMGAPDPRESASGGSKKRVIDLAKESRHWAYQPLKAVRLPALKQGASWCKTTLDTFVLEKLTAKGITPNPLANRRTLIRRAYLDLLGLPPVPEEVEAFVNDRSPNAWEKVVDRLLASPHYGERWARHWLDLARFAESHGYEQDYDRPYAYHYRDFVIKALNQDMPYDRFVQWQLAGDEMAPEEPMALMATGFLAAGTHATQITKNQVEKERYDELDDMLSTTGTAFLGLTLGCARCHDHKFDPFPQKDYYRLLSTFTTTVRSDYDVNMDPAGYRKAKAAFDAEHAPLVEARSRWEKEQLPGKLDRWLSDRAYTQRKPAWLMLDITSAKSEGGATFTTLDDGSLLATGKNPDNDTYTFVAKTGLTNITGLRLEALSHPSLVKGGPGRAANGNFALTSIKVTAAPTDGKGQAVEVKLVNPRSTFDQKGLPFSAALAGDKKSGWAVDPQFGKDHAAATDFEKPVGFPGGTTLTVTLKFENNVSHSIGRPRLSVSTQTLPLDASNRPEPVEAVLLTLADGKTTLDAGQRGTLRQWLARQDPEWQALDKKVQIHLAQEPKAPIQKILISSEGVPAVRTHTQGGDFLEHTHFLRRGDPNLKEEVAAQGFLQVLTRTPEGEKRWVTVPPKGWRTSYQRLSLAKWMTDVEAGAGHLLARVIVNRLWQHHFGRGIVATPSDFGTQGERPTHPELLDWLASELIRSGWKLKPIHKLIMTSAVYMQSSAPNARQVKLDPDNKLYGRFARHRLEAECIRDSMLAVSGLLDKTMYGPGTLDENMKRRSIYFFVKRSKLIPAMLVFDGPNALLGLAARPTTTVAPQALMMMNSPQVREYALAFARRLLEHSTDGSYEGIVDAAYREALSRPPTSKELAQSVAFIKAAKEPYTKAGASNDIEPAVADFCQVLISLNEFVYIE